MTEKTASDAPVWYSAEAAAGWANGYNAAFEENTRKIEELELMWLQAQKAISRFAPYLSADDADLTQDQFLRCVADRINDDLASKAKQAIDRNGIPHRWPDGSPIKG
jgi:hypothetical protein